MTPHSSAQRLVTLYFGLAGVYRQINNALRTIWSDTHDRRTASRASPTVEKQIASVALVVALGVVVLLSVLADGAIAVTRLGVCKKRHCRDRILR